MTPPALVRTLCCALFATAMAASPMGFGEPGHRVIGHIAELHLGNTRALAEARRILNPGETLADAGVWADTIRNATYDDADGAPFRLAHPAHDTYHYTNLPFQADRYVEGQPGTHFTDIVRVLRECIRVLRGESKTFTPRHALRFVAHLVGDIHQPLHVGNAFVSTDEPLRFVRPEGGSGWRPSLGGNALRYGPKDNFNLHSYWDSHAVNLVMRKEVPAAFAARLVREVRPQASWSRPGDAEAWPESWAAEALALAREAHDGIQITAYLGPTPSHRWRIVQPAGYDDRARTAVRMQLAKGGYRLAATLRAIWP